MSIELSDFQQEQYNKFVEKRYCNIAWETGVGKTFPILKYLLEHPDEKYLIIAPKTVTKQWIIYCQKYDLKFYDWGDEKSLPANIEICGLELFTKRNSIPQAGSKEYKEYQKKITEMQRKFKEYNLILDECHKIKAPTSQIARILKKLFFKRYAFLSGTGQESGAWDNFIYFFINPYFNWGGFKRPTSFTEFKKLYCTVDIWGSIEGMNKSLEELFKSEWSFKQHDKDWVVESEIQIPVDVITKNIFKYSVGDYDTFIKMRQIVNGFVYLQIGERKECLIFSETEKITALKSLLALSDDKILVFFEFDKERQDLRQIEGGFEYKDIKSVEEFENNDCKFMFAHYKSLGTGVRLSYINEIVLYTLALSNTAKNQSIGRGKFAERTKPLYVYTFAVDSEFERDIKENNKKKWERFMEFKNGTEKTKGNNQSDD